MEKKLRMEKYHLKENFKKGEIKIYNLLILAKDQKKEMEIKGKKQAITKS